jgi:hypothetical protein
MYLNQQNIASPINNSFNTWCTNPYYTQNLNYSYSTGSSYNSTIESTPSYHDSYSTSLNNSSFHDNSASYQTSHYASSSPINTNNYYYPRKLQYTDYYDPNYQTTYQNSINQATVNNQYDNSWSYYYTANHQYKTDNPNTTGVEANQLVRPDQVESPINVPKTNKVQKNIGKEFDKKILPLLVEDSKPSRARTAFSIDQRHYLLSIFETTSYPSKDILEQAARRLNTTTLVIQTWFKNTRSKQKKLVNKKCF